MVADVTLVLLLDEVRGKTLAILEGLSQAQARWAPAGLHNSILWHAGHAYVVVEWLTLTALGRQPQMPPGWFDLFSWDSEPATTADDAWPQLQAVRGQLLEQHQRLRALIAGLSEEQLRSPSQERSGAPVRYSILHALHDEAGHGGEIWLLRKLLATNLLHSRP